MQLLLRLENYIFLNLYMNWPRTNNLEQDQLANKTCIKYMIKKL